MDNKQEKMIVVRHIIEDNHNGATIIMEVNPKDRTVKAKWSVCTKDNFSRKVGRQKAEERPWLFAFKVKSLDSFKERFFKALTDSLQIYDPYAYLAYGDEAYIEVLKTFLKREARASHKKAY